MKEKLFDRYGFIFFPDKFRQFYYSKNWINSNLQAAPSPTQNSTSRSFHRRVDYISSRKKYAGCSAMSCLKSIINSRNCTQVNRQSCQVSEWLKIQKFA